MLEELIVKLYDAFNRRNTDEVLAYFHPEVEWPNAMEGGHIKGHQAIRDYWTRQWNEINPKVTPVHFDELKNSVEVEVVQLIRDLNGQILSNKLIKHQYKFKDNLIVRMDIKQ